MQKENSYMALGFLIVFGIAGAAWGGVVFAKNNGILPEDFLSKKQPEVLSEKDSNEDLDHPGLLDYDGDGLNNFSEEEAGTDLNLADTDGDGYTDKEEIESNNNPLVPAEEPKSSLFGTNNDDQEVPEDDFTNDADGDGLSDAQEKVYKTDPNKADTDGDGYTDKEEIASGNNPLR